MTSSRPSPLRVIFAAALIALASVSVAACDAEDPECSKDADCPEISCTTGPMQTCDDGVCLQGDDCEVESSGGW